MESSKFEANVLHFFPLRLRLGILFPPDENGLIKICSVRLVTNFGTHAVANSSILHSVGDFPHDGSPAELEEEMRQFVRDAAPELADRPFVSTRLCWLVKAHFLFLFFLYLLRARPSLSFVPDRTAQSHPPTHNTIHIPL